MPPSVTTVRWVCLRPQTLRDSLHMGWGKQWGMLAQRARLETNFRTISNATEPNRLAEFWPAWRGQRRCADLWSVRGARQHCQHRHFCGRAYCVARNVYSRSKCSRHVNGDGGSMTLFATSCRAGRKSAATSPYPTWTKSVCESAHFRDNMRTVTRPSGCGSRCLNRFVIRARRQRYSRSDQYV